MCVEKVSLRRYKVTASVISVRNLELNETSSGPLAQKLNENTRL